MSGFHITITTGSGTPIYRQMIDQVRLGVATETLAPGDALPSVRGLAEQNLVNANTVVKSVRRVSARRCAGIPPRQRLLCCRLRATRSENELSLIIANPNGRTERDLEALGALAVDEQPLSLEDALIAHVGRQGDKGFFLNMTGGAR
jgi:DNA-binding transcriptional MocR family regulator